jgi:hypothetical protein
MVSAGFLLGETKMAIRVIQESRGNLIISNQFGEVYQGHPSDFNAFELCALAGDLSLSPEEVGQAALIIGAANPQRQAAALGVDFQKI